jgi:5-methylcytosine-specific restriction endonuclease McrA
MSKDTRTYSDRKVYIIKAVVKRRKKVRLKAIEALGGKCMRCGYNKCMDALEFHHKNPTDKDFCISGKGYCRSWEKVSKELEKCDLLCANCHRELHAELDKSISS